MTAKKVQHRAKRIVIGLTGRIESAVAAFLLKKQGHECLGIAVSFFDEDEQNDNGHFQIEKLDHISKICQFLEIPFYAVDAKKDFERDIVMKIVSARLGGEACSVALHTHSLLLKILAQKAELLKADYIATGHFAKVYQNRVTGDSSLMASSIIEQDQSYLLSLVDESILPQLQLPLSEIGVKEVEKVANLIKDEVQLTNGQDLPYFLSESYIQHEIARLAAPSLKPEGDIIRLEEDTTICAHDGIHLYSLGQTEITCANGNKLDSKYQILNIHPGRGSIFVDRPGTQHFNGCYATTYYMPRMQNMSAPMRVKVRRDRSAELLPATLIFKPYGTLAIRFDKNVEQIFMGQHIVIYEPLANSQRVLCAARVLQVNNFDFYDRVYASPDGEDDEKNLFLSMKSRYGYFF